MIELHQHPIVSTSMSTIFAGHVKLYNLSYISLSNSRSDAKLGAMLLNGNTYDVIYDSKFNFFVERWNHISDRF